MIKFMDQVFILVCEIEILVFLDEVSGSLL